MIDGLYSGAAAMNMLEQQHEMISSNLAHANSSGHRRAFAAVMQRKPAEGAELANQQLGPQVDKVARDFSTGRMVESGRPLDVAIMGDGFFVFDNQGQELLTRNGRLFRDPTSNQLVNDRGLAIQGEGGPITLDPAISEQAVVIASDGTVSANGQELGKLKTVVYEDNNKLLPVGVTGFQAGPEAVLSDETASVAQRRHELSNVQPVIELVSLIVNSRHHEAIERASRTISETLSEYIRE